MKYKVLYVSEPYGEKTEAFDNRMYSIMVEDENGKQLNFSAPVCFTKKSLKIMIESILHRYNTHRKPCVKKGDIL